MKFSATIILILICTHLKGQEIYRFSTKENYFPNDKNEYYSLLKNGEFIYTVRIKGLSVGFQNQGFWKQINKDSILISSFEFDTVVIKKNKIQIQKFLSTYDIKYLYAYTPQKIKFNIDGFNNFIPNYSLVYYSNGLITKVDTITKSILLTENKVDSFYIVDLNTGIVSETYLGRIGVVSYNCKRNTNRVFINEYILRSSNDEWVSPTNIYGKYLKIPSLTFSQSKEKPNPH